MRRRTTEKEREVCRGGGRPRRRSDKKVDEIKMNAVKRERQTQECFEKMLSPSFCCLHLSE